MKLEWTVSILKYEKEKWIKGNSRKAFLEGVLDQLQNTSALL
jgi:hypothetical protein